MKTHPEDSNKGVVLALFPDLIIGTRRPMAAYAPAAPALPGGWLRHGEDPVVGAMREFEEELGPVARALLTRSGHFQTVWSCGDPGEASTFIVEYLVERPLGVLIAAAAALDPRRDGGLTDVRLILGQDTRALEALTRTAHRPTALTAARALARARLAQRARRDRGGAQ